MPFNKVTNNSTARFAKTRRLFCSLAMVGVLSAPSYAQSVDLDRIDRDLAVGFQNLQHATKIEHQQRLADGIYNLTEKKQFVEALKLCDQFVENGGAPETIMLDRVNCIIEIGQPGLAVEILKGYFSERHVNPDKPTNKGSIWNQVDRALSPQTIVALALLAKARMHPNFQNTQSASSVGTVMNYLYCQLEAIYSKKDYRSSDTICQIGIACAIRCIEGCQKNPVPHKQVVGDLLEMLDKNIESAREKSQIQSLQRYFKEMVEDKATTAPNKPEQIDDTGSGEVKVRVKRLSNEIDRAQKNCDLLEKQIASLEKRLATMLNPDPFSGVYLQVVNQKNLLEYKRDLLQTRITELENELLDLQSP